MTKARRVMRMPPLLARPFWSTLGLALATGLWLSWARADLYGSFGIAGVMHRAFGWLALPLMTLYQTVHVANRWGVADRRERFTGIGVLGLSSVLLYSGVSLEQSEPLLPSEIAKGLHRWTTVGFGVLLLVHSGPVVLGRWRRRRRQRILR